MVQCEKLFLISFLRYLKAMCSFDFWTALRYCCKQFRDGPNSKNLVLPDSSFSRWTSDILMKCIRKYSNVYTAVLHYTQIYMCKPRHTQSHSGIHRYIHLHTGTNIGRYTHIGILTRYSI